MSLLARPAAARMKVSSCERVNGGDTAAADRRRTEFDFKQNRVERLDDLEDSGPPPRSKLIHPAPKPSVSTYCAPYSSAASTSSAAAAALLMPSTPLTFSSISAITAGLSFRNIFAFSRPCPIRWEL